MKIHKLYIAPYISCCYWTPLTIFPDPSHGLSIYCIPKEMQFLYCHTWSWTRKLNWILYYIQMIKLWFINQKIIY